MRLIVNADDFGYSRGQNYGIIDACRNGIVRSATLMATGPAVEHAAELAHANPSLGVGVHLVLDMGRPILAPELIPSLVGPSGYFLRPAFESSLDVDLYEVEQEWRAQIAKVRELGILPTHLDGHHHFHLHPQLVQVTCKLAAEFSLPVRRPNPEFDMGAHADAYKVLETVSKPEYCLTDFYDTGVDEEYFFRFFETRPHLRGRTVELMCHPAYLDDVIFSQSSYNIQRVKELQVLKSGPVSDWALQNEVELINFSQL